MGMGMANADGFNTQPPEGGWSSDLSAVRLSPCFNTQPPEGGWLSRVATRAKNIMFQHTAARRRLEQSEAKAHAVGVFQHTAARRRLVWKIPIRIGTLKFQHTAARRRLGFRSWVIFGLWLFQHTAARRRLDQFPKTKEIGMAVSTHSRPKAAGPPFDRKNVRQICFNTQPPEGGWLDGLGWGSSTQCFNTQPPEGGWVLSEQPKKKSLKFQHTAARRRLGLMPCRLSVDFEFQHTAARRRLAGRCDYA